MLRPVGDLRAGGRTGDKTDHCPERWGDRWSECPWLLDSLATGRKPSRDPKPNEDIGDEPLHAIDADNVMDALETPRAKWLESDRCEYTHVKWRIPGGKWMAAHQGIAYDAFQAPARGADGNNFGFRMAFAPQRQVITLLSMAKKVVSFLPPHGATSFSGLTIRLRHTVSRRWNLSQMVWLPSKNQPMCQNTTRQAALACSPALTPCDPSGRGSECRTARG